MPLIVYVYKNPLGDASNGGISSISDKLLLVNVDGPLDPKDCSGIPPAMLVDGNLDGTVKIVPAYLSDDDQGKWTVWKPLPLRSSMGGNYAATSDGRFSKAIEKLTGNYFYGAVAIHDRFE